MKLFIIGFLFVSVVGTLLHFVYEKSKHNKVVGLFGAVNESTWEHIKMALTPTFMWSFVLGITYGTNPNFFPAILASLLTIIIVIPLIFYGYQIFVKKSILIIDISSFFIAVFLSQLFAYLILNLAPFSYNIIYISVLGLLVVFGFFLLATVIPPETFIFKDPITGKYGVKGHPEDEDIKKHKKK